MNSAASCHEIQDCPGLYVDAFRGKFSARTRDPNCAFVLTHYHGDHYSGLPRENKFQGPAQIHCTPVTANLLLTVHEVPQEFVVEHAYSETWTYHILGSADKTADVTFYDAHHCPGAAIVLIDMPHLGVTHLHTGDMRFHDKMKSYPRLQQAVQKQQLDLVYLDTTYGHPKHDFVPQEEAIDTIASHVEGIQGSDGASSKTLVLLSCYSIGKEKVLWETSTRCNQLVHVTERKMEMLRCIQSNDQEASSQMIERCTLDPAQSNIHVVPMGLAGQLWPFFQPNYWGLLEYVEKLEKRYDAIVAFLPTGWANGSNWNKKNAVSKKRVDRKLSEGTVDIEIRLVSYSEHSAFSELRAFVEYLRPRKVVPTVYSDDNDRRKIEGHFRNLVDTTRAKRQFFMSMSKGNKREEDNSNATCSASLKVESTSIVATTPRQHKKPRIDDAHVATLVSMGFGIESSRRSLESHRGDFQATLEHLLGGTPPAPVGHGAQKESSRPKVDTPSPTITQFFAPKKS